MLGSERKLEIAFYLHGNYNPGEEAMDFPIEKWMSASMGFVGTVLHEEKDLNWAWTFEISECEK